MRRPDASPYLRREGLLFLDKDQLQTLMDSTIDAQPFLGQLVADPSARGLFAALSLLGIGVEKGQADLTPYATALEGFHKAMAAALAGHAEPLSWQRLLGGSTSELGGKYKFVLVQPKLDYGDLQPGGAATEAMRAGDRRAGIREVRAGAGAHHRLGRAGRRGIRHRRAGRGDRARDRRVVLITVWLFLALRSWRLIVPALATLMLGLMLTLLFASLAVGTLNLVSVAFAILFVGIAVDFAIQFSVRYREWRFELRRSGPRAGRDRAAVGHADPRRRGGDGVGLPGLRADRLSPASPNWG